MDEDTTTPLVALPEGEVLTTTELQDRYFVVGKDGSVRSASVDEAVAVYRIHGVNPENLLWKKPKRVRRKGSHAKDTDSSEWRRELARKLGMVNDDE